MKYSVDEFIAAAEQELERWKCEGEKKRTDFDYEKLGFVRAVAKRLQDQQPVLPQNHVSGALPPSEDDIHSAADEWVFETNGMRWSNNDNTAGDNFGSFVAGAKYVLQQLGGNDR